MNSLRRVERVALNKYNYYVQINVQDNLYIISSVWTESIVSIGIFQADKIRGASIARFDIQVGEFDGDSVWHIWRSQHPTATDVRRIIAWKIWRTKLLFIVMMRGKDATF